MATIGAVFTGAVFGDHCSPISDTTIMSSMASAPDHIDHVKTQIPYALTVAVIGINPLISIVLGLAIAYGVIQKFGETVESEEIIQEKKASNQ